jgi:hypothetical protein
LNFLDERVRARKGQIVGSALEQPEHMTKSLIIAEKPSVAQDIVRARTPESGKFEKHADHFESDRDVVTSAVGHLV